MILEKGDYSLCCILLLFGKDINKGIIIINDDDDDYDDGMKELWFSIYIR